MGSVERVSTGISGFDQVIDMLRIGDNVVWQVDSIEDYRYVTIPYVRQSMEDRRRLVYMRFGRHEPVLPIEQMEKEYDNFQIYRLSPEEGFESFATKVHEIITREGLYAFYVFDCLTDLLQDWCSDLMIGNFFRVTCPYLFELDTVAYFPLIRNAHTYDTIARIRETTQVLLDLYSMNGNYYVHPLKVWERYAPTMFFPHQLKGDKALSITSSADAALLFSRFTPGGERRDYWDILFDRAVQALDSPSEEQEELKEQLLGLLVGKESRMRGLCSRYFTLADLIQIEKREIGTGFIGGKAVGMLVARKILETTEPELYQEKMEPHDSFYLGSDVFYTYIVQNGWWKLRTRQKTREGYYACAGELREKLLRGSFPSMIKEKFMHMLEYFGQSPVIVRSSSLLEDNFGNAFAGKYDSVFCANQGTPEERYAAFEQAVRTVYASTMNPDALAYRMNRGLYQRDEQMALLVQRVSGDHYGNYFFPHAAGVGNSSNLFVWDKDTDASKGMLRLVFGMGTRAVDRVEGDYPRIVCLDDPSRPPLVAYGDEYKFSQHYVDLLNLQSNELETIPLSRVPLGELRTDPRLFMEQDRALADRFREAGQYDRKVPNIINFPGLLRRTDFPACMERILHRLSEVYEYPVDIEFTCNCREDASYRVNLLQCRPLQTRGLGEAVEMPRNVDPADCLFRTHGNFMGGNVCLPIRYVVFVKIGPYLALKEQDKYAVARQIGQLNQALKGKDAMLLGPGRWGTTTPSLGVPVHFTEICHMSVLGEVAYTESGLMPELSYGSHFFQDLVESGLFYTAIFQGDKDVVFHEEQLTGKENCLERLLETVPREELFSQVIHVADYSEEPLQVWSDTVRQELLCKS